jgi:uncharacterized membrane protein YgaE (UPF0421/DUF939 family)
MSFVSLRRLIYFCTPSSLHRHLTRIETSEIGSRLASGVFWSVGDTLISRGLMLCAAILVARMLGRTGYGELGMIQSIVDMFGVFAGFRLQEVAVGAVVAVKEAELLLPLGRSLSPAGQLTSLRLLW